jgi:ribonucleotide monophosphatase NagD (HAD superfamily)
MVCANPDKVVQRGDRLIYCGGALADLYKTLGGRVVMAGKPHAPIYDLSLARAEEFLGRPVDRGRVLAIGDAIATDILGAQMQGLDPLFIASGIHGDAAIDPGGALNLAALEALRSADEAAPNFAMADLAW